MPNDDEEFESFMHKVDTIGSIIQRLNSKDEAVVNEATTEAELCLKGKNIVKIDEGSCIIKHNRTVINRNAFNDDDNDPTSTSKDAFMSMVARDAEERARLKRERERRARKFMKDADKCILEGDNESALYLYTKAIEENVNWPKLFLERAKIHLVLKLYRKACEDSEKAMKLNEDLLFLKGENANTRDKEEAEIMASDAKSVKEQALQLYHSD